MRKLLVVGLVLVGIPLGLVAANLCDVAGRIVTSDCVSQADLFPVLNALFGDCLDIPEGPVADIVAAFIDNGWLPKDFVYDPTACVSKGFVSQILYHALGLRPSLMEWIRIATLGLDPDTATAIAQRRAVMATGAGTELLTGREFVACILAWIQAELNAGRIPCGSFYQHRAQLISWSNCIQRRVMTAEEAAVYIPGLIIVPTS